MKKLFLILTALLLLCPKSYSATEDNIALLTKKGFFNTTPISDCKKSNPCEDIRHLFYSYLKYANTYNTESLKSLYSDKYINADGFNKEIYFDLVKKTWDSYPDIKYKMNIKNIEINGNNAIVEVNETALASTDSKSGLIKQKGRLESTAESIYYLENTTGKWLIASDHIAYEKTFLGYGSAMDVNVKLIAPCQIPAGTQYTSSLRMDVPKNSLIIASIGQEKTTYPQIAAEEVFRKIPEDGILERVFKSNDKNVNEYSIASFGITKAEFGSEKEIRIYITGLGFIMTRVNVIPKNDFIKVAENEKTK